MKLSCQETARKVYEYHDGEWIALMRESLTVEQPTDGFTDRLMISVKEFRIKMPLMLPVKTPFPEIRYPFSGKGSEAEPWEQAWTSLEPLRQLWFTISHYSHDYYLNLTMDRERREVHAG